MKHATLSEKLSELARALPQLELSTDEATSRAHARDWWLPSLLRERQGSQRRPAAVARPRSSAEVAAVLAWANRHALGVVPYGLGSGVCGGIAPEHDQLVLDLGQMKRIQALNEHTLTVVVQPGMRGSDFEAALRARGYTMGHFPQSIALSSVGGWCATRAAGQYSTRYGNIENMLIGCEVALADGRLIRLAARPRASTGPELRELFLGSEGTLGVFTELTFRIRPLPDAEAMAAFVLPSVDAGVEILRRVLRRGWQPAVTRLYDGLEAGRHFATSSQGAPMLLVLSEGARALVDGELAAVREVAASLGASDAGEAPVRSWLEHRNHVPDFETLVDQGLVADTIEVAAGWDVLPELFRRVVEEAAGMDGLLMLSGHVSHCYLDGANIYFTFVGTHAGDFEKALALYDKVWEHTLRLTHELGGTIAHHHGIGRVRKRWLKTELGEAHHVLRLLKKALDPSGILNPGVLIDDA
jgi:alkyldihydroxyacetonephosphate synthase